MNYQKVYDALIQKRIQNPAIKTGPGTIEVHHILPKSMGGSNDKSNLVSLTPKEHFVSHHLLWKIHNNDKMFLAFWYMSNTKKSIKITSRIYQNLRIRFGQWISNHVYTERERINRSNAQIGHFVSEETKQKIREKALKRKPASEETRRKISQKLKGHKSYWVVD